MLWASRVRVGVYPLAFVCLGGSVGAADLTSVSGRVADATGAALPSAALAIRDLDRGFERIGRSGPDGRYEIAGLSPGRYRIMAFAPGFAPNVRDFETPSPAPIDLMLDVAAVVEQVTVVSGSRQDELRSSLSTRVEVVGGDRIRDTGYESVAEVLREMPGVLTRRGSAAAGGGAGEQIQGIDSRQVLVLMDGLPLIGARGIKRGILNLDRQSVARLDRVEVVKGACSTLYGSDAIGGVINLITREPESPIELSWHASGGSQAALDSGATVGFARSRVAGIFTLERHENDGFDLTPTTFDTTGASLRRYDAFGKVRYQLAPALSVTALLSSYWNDESGRSIGELGPQDNDTRDAARGFGLTGAGRLGERTTFELRSYLAIYDEASDVLLATPGSPQHSSGTLFERLGRVDGTFSRAVAGRHFVQVGAEWSSDHYRGDNRLRDDAGHDVSTAVAWLQDRISLGRRVTATLGARYDRHGRFGSALSPKAALHARVSDALSVRASYGRGFRAPDLGQLYYRFLNPTSSYQVIGNPDLEAEYADSWQAGAEIAPAGGRFRLGINVFRNEVRDLIESVSLGFVASPAQLSSIMSSEGIDPSFRPQLDRLLFRYENVADARTQGIEADAEITLPRGFSVSAAYTYLDAIDEATGLTLTGRQPHHGFARLAWASRRLGLRVNVRGTFMSSWVAARQTLGGATQDTRAAAFSLWDLYAAKRIVGGLEAYGSVDNLTDSQDPNVGVFTSTGAPAPIYRPEVGRTVRAGVRWAWTRASAR
jgi:outer membrane receptor for ferrienterochelin and colicins